MDGSSAQNALLVETDDEFDESFATESPVDFGFKKESNDILDHSHQLCRHPCYMKAECITCGLTKSMEHSNVTRKRNDDMNTYLHFQKKKRNIIKANGHCLPRAVFYGAKNLNLIPNIITYKALMKEAIDWILKNLDTYTDYLTNGKDHAKLALTEYLEKKVYYSEDNIIDVMLIALSVLTCDIEVHYQDIDGSFEKHVISPNDGTEQKVRLAYVNGHYDCITDIIKNEATTERNLIVKNNYRESHDQRKRSASPPHLIHQSSSKKQIGAMVDGHVHVRERSEIGADNGITTDISADYDYDEIGEDDEMISGVGEACGIDDTHYVDETSCSSISDEDVMEKGTRTYINELIFEDLEEKNADSVPNDIDGIAIFIVPLKKNLKNCKGGRPWGRMLSSKSKDWSKGPRLLTHCKGSYHCSNIRCDNIADFGVNRADFVIRNKSDVHPDVLCKICKCTARYIKCNARLYIEKDLSKKTIRVKHYGDHTCLPVKCCDRERLEKVVESNTFMSRQGIIRQQIGQSLQETRSFATSVDIAKSLDNTTLINNIKKKAKRLSHPHGQSFEAVQHLKESFDKEDGFLIYEIDDGRESGIPLVIKSSKRKVEILHNLDKDGDHCLHDTAVHLDVIHSRTKGFKTYTLSYYDVRLNSMVVLCTMDTVSECKEACTLFFLKINQMLNDYLVIEGDSNAGGYAFNPYHLKDDEHGGNKIGMANVFGKRFVEEQTSSCEYHFNESVKRHGRYFKDPAQYFQIISRMKHGSSELMYLTAKDEFDALKESAETAAGKKSLDSFIHFWHERKFRWVDAYRKHSLCQIPRSSLAEASHAKMKSGGRKNLSLVDAAFADIQDSAVLESRWQNRKEGERSHGTGPTGINLIDREEMRQVAHGQRVLHEMGYDLSDSSIDEDGIYDPTKSHRPDKNSVPLPNLTLSQRSRRSLNSKAFNTALTKAKQLTTYTKITGIIKRKTGIDVTMLRDQNRYMVSFSENVYCTCSPSQRADRKTCCHIVWLLLNLFEIEEEDPIVAQVSLDRKSLSFLFERCPEEVPEALSKCLERPIKRIFHPQINNHPLCNAEQSWYVERKEKKASTCAGCLKKGEIKIGSLHLAVDGLLYLTKQNAVFSTTHRFCASKRCITEIKSKANNIRNNSSMQVKESEKYPLTEEERACLISEGFIFI